MDKRNGSQNFNQRIKKKKWKINCKGFKRNKNASFPKYYLQKIQSNKFYGSFKNNKNRNKKVRFYKLLQFKKEPQ